MAPKFDETDAEAVLEVFQDAISKLDDTLDPVEIALRRFFEAAYLELSESQDEEVVPYGECVYEMPLLRLAQAIISN